MKTFKKDIFKLFLIVTIINLVAFGLSIKLQSFYVENFYELIEEAQNKPQLNNAAVGVASVSNNFNYYLEATGEHKKFCVNKSQNSIDSSGNNNRELCVYGFGVNIILSLPFILYFTVLFLTIIYFVYNINKLLKEAASSLDSIKGSLDKLEVNNYNHKYKELREAQEVVDNSIYLFKRNKLLENELINSLAHDMKTPLHIINGYNDMQLHKQKEPLFNEKIKEQIKLMNNIIDQILDESYFNRKQIDVLFVIKTLINEYKLIYKTVDFEVISDNDKVYYNVDVITFKRIVINLIDNAINALESKKQIKVYVNESCIIFKNYGKLFTQKEFKKYIQNENVKKEGLGLKIIYTNCLKNNLNIYYKNNKQDITEAKVSKIPTEIKED